MNMTSHPWKQRLHRQAEALEALRKPHRWSEASAVKLEEAVVLGFYAVRRLLNAFLLSTAQMHRPIPMRAFPVRRTDSPVLGDESPEELYDLKAGRAVAHDLIFLAHQVMHNCAFVPFFDSARRLQGIYVTSDHQRKVALYGIEIGALCELFAGIAAER
jgi:hypothetical protein